MSNFFKDQWYEDFDHLSNMHILARVVLYILFYFFIVNLWEAMSVYKLAYFEYLDTFQNYTGVNVQIIKSAFDKVVSGDPIFLIINICMFVALEFFVQKNKKGRQNA